MDAPKYYAFRNLHANFGISPAVAAQSVIAQGQALPSEKNGKALKIDHIIFLELEYVRVMDDPAHPRSTERIWSFLTEN